MNDNAVVIADAEGIIRYWSDAAERMFGHRPERAVGQTLDLIVPDDYRQAHWAGFRHAIDSGTAAAEGVVSPFPARLADGAVALLPGRLILMRQAEGKVIAAMVVFG